ncbi:unnamed protein product [Porites evermanni]|uniref:DNA helicase MCM9 n=1 Tax=Porites evermanni TaxID=104178 RepID=A0ABN8Q500_9CNID|nr:unnamed protein product [Porites evermanni]
MSQTNCQEEDHHLAVFQAFLEEHHRDDISKVLHADDPSDQYCVVVNALELFDSNIEVSQKILAEPNKMLPLFDAALAQAAVTIMQENATQVSMSFKSNLHVRLSNLPICPELRRDTIPKSSDIGRFLAVSGTVIRVSTVKLLEYEREYICCRCKHVFGVKADFEQFYSIPKPTKCPSSKECNSNKFNCLSDGASEPKSCRDYQEIKIQEQVQKLAVGTIPRAMWVVLEDDLVDSCKAGDDVTICGVVMRRWKPVFVDSRCDLEVVLKANHLSVNNEQRAGVVVTEELKREFADFWQKYTDAPLQARNHILSSFCPQVYGLYAVKLAVALVLIGGVQRVDPSGMRVRGESHLLLVGDPGTGKSQFLKYAAKITPRSVLTTGIGSTSAGLTVAAVRDSGEWQLEAGALVLADGGLSTVSKNMTEHVRDHSVDDVKLSIPFTSVINPPLPGADPGFFLGKGAPLRNGPSTQAFLGELVFHPLKTPAWEIVSSFILEGKGLRTTGSSTDPLWSMEKMQAYFCYIKTFKPQLTLESNRILSRYYHCQRQADLRNAARTTIRLLESLIRLAQAHARLMFREFVTVQDAIVAVTCVECSMQNSALLGSMNALHTRFPDDPQEEYSRQAKLVLKRLNLDDMVRSIDTATSIENHKGGGAENSGDAENNLLSPNESLPANEEVRGEENKALNSAAEESDKVFSENEMSILNNPIDEVDSNEQLTGVFPISSSEIGTNDLVEETPNTAWHVSERKRKTCGQDEPISANNLGDERNKIVNDDASSKRPRLSTSLRTITNANENDSTKTIDHNATALMALEKSKRIIEMFSKKPATPSVVNTHDNDCQAPSVVSSNIFVTEELDEDDLEDEWPTDLLSFKETEGDLNPNTLFRRRKGS